ncbi:proline-rich protein 18-like [Chionomys nivalis]|uniref:proline-rich protein 18-like n=1 Tax=Chionomys nivalis TaxID=269649 RepID=UPI0025938753|nr:proline-rich protein 18-like [Chionomys nivalis]
MVRGGAGRLVSCAGAPPPPAPPPSPASCKVLGRARTRLPPSPPAPFPAAAAAAATGEEAAAARNPRTRSLSLARLAFSLSRSWQPRQAPDPEHFQARALLLQKVEGSLSTRYQGVIWVTSLLQPTNGYARPRPSPVINNRADAGRGGKDQHGHMGTDDEVSLGADAPTGRREWVSLLVPGGSRPEPARDRSAPLPGGRWRFDTARRRARGIILIPFLPLFLESGRPCPPFHPHPQDFVPSPPHPFPFSLLDRAPPLIRPE